MSGPDDDDLDDIEPLTPEEERAVSALLAALPAEPMPPEVLARIEAALADEPPLAGTSANVLPSLDAARTRRRALHGQLLFRVAASVVGLAGAIAVGLVIVNSGGSSSAGSASTVAEGAASTGTSSAAASSAFDSTSRPASGSATRLTRSGRSYDAANLAPAATQLVKGLTIPPTTLSAAGSGTSAAEPSPTATTKQAPKTPTTVAALAASPQLLNACVRELTDGDGRQALAVDVGTWAGHDALVIVLPPVTGTTDLAVFVVSPTCGQVDDSTDILKFVTVPHP
jgi:hypothetical protein